MSIEIARKHLEKYGLEDKILEFDVSSATVELAAEAVGTEPQRICKTISFKKPEGGAILVQTAGDTKIKNGKFKGTFGFKAKMLPAEEVELYTNHQIGGVCGFGITNKETEIYVDESLKRFATVFPACGSSNSAIELTPEEVFKYSEALDWVDVCDIIE
ncbi:MAG: YbaK/EbsC family protein [Eubacteriales bacterium]|nr:YbaK/EbsC family protein [Eubacteriales bacterium]MDY3333238.1 YbaK/EbsC family protein [Gallibacter sp.]